MDIEQQVIKTRIAEVWLGEDGIVRLIITSPGAELGLEDAIEGETTLAAITGGKPAPVLADIRKVKSASRENRMYARRPEFMGLISAGAMLVDSPVTQMIGNFFVTVGKPPVPARLFRSEEEALAWLAGFVEND